MVQTIFQCPVSGGNTVFRARALLAIIDSDTHYNDRDLCNRVGIALRTSKSENNLGNVKLYPNPANDKVTLLYQLQENETATFTVTNAVGQVVLQKQLKGEQVTFEFNTKGFAPSMYYYSLSGNNSLHENGKLIIIH